MGKLDFSRRQGIDNIFKLNCELTSSAYTIANFLSWLQNPGNQIGRGAINRILEEDIIHQDT